MYQFENYVEKNEGKFYRHFYACSGKRIKHFLIRKIFRDFHDKFSI